MASMISAQQLTRTFKTKTGPVEAVKGISFEVASGEIVGLLGPNGAGKTTTLRMLTTLLVPSAGSATVAGVDLKTEARKVRGLIGYVSQIGAAPSPGTLLGEELITQARLQGMSKGAAVDRLKTLLPSLDLAGFERRALSEMSGGQRRRFDIALGLMHQPKIIFLDEPTTGLDPQSRANLWDHIRKLRSEHGTTVLLTTHYLDEADALADRLVVMDHGAIVANDTADALKSKISGDVVTVKVIGDAQAALATAKAAVPTRAASVEADQLHLTVERGAEAVAPIVRALLAAGVTITSVETARPSLDAVFLTLTGRTLREDAEGKA